MEIAHTMSVRKRMWPRVVLIGDSLTQQGGRVNGGWVARIAEALERKCDVVNRGFSGYTTRTIRVSKLVSNSMVDCSKLLKGHFSTSKICLLLLLNLPQICYRFTSATIYDRAECQSWA